MRDNQKLLERANKATMERLTDPKNVIKGDFPEKLSEALRLYRLEHEEILAEVMEYPPDFEKLRYEIADGIVCLAFAISCLDRLIEGGEK